MNTSLLHHLLFIGLPFQSIELSVIAFVRRGVLKFRAKCLDLGLSDLDLGHSDPDLGQTFRTYIKVIRTLI